MGFKPIYPPGAEPPRTPNSASPIVKTLAEGVAKVAEQAATASTADGPLFNPAVRRAADALAKSIRNRTGNEDGG